MKRKEKEKKGANLRTLGSTYLSPELNHRRKGAPKRRGKGKPGGFARCALFLLSSYLNCRSAVCKFREKSPRKKRRGKGFFYKKEGEEKMPLGGGRGEKEKIDDLHAP